jgi:hypothetical protein
MMITSSLRNSYRFFHNGGGLVGHRAQGAIALARAELTARDKVADGEWRYRWEPDSDVDASWMDSHTLQDYNSGTFEVMGCILEKKCAQCGSWETLDSLWGICVYPDDDYQRQIEGELALEGV